MKLNWNFVGGGGGGGVQNKKPSVGGVWIFPGTAQWSSRSQLSELCWTTHPVKSKPKK